MEILNAIISNAAVGIDDRDRLSARVTFDTQFGSCNWGFILTKPTDSKRVLKLLEYTGTGKFNNLNGKHIRMVMHENYFRGFGDIIEDRFIPAFGDKLKEVKEDEFKELLERKE